MINIELLNYLGLDPDEYEETYRELDPPDQLLCENLINRLQQVIGSADVAYDSHSSDKHTADKLRSGVDGMTPEQIKHHIYDLLGFVHDDELEDLVEV